MERSEQLLLDALRCAVRGEQVSWEQPPDPKDYMRTVALARTHSILPLFVEATAQAAQAQFPELYGALLREAKRLTLAQAQRTAEFLLLLDGLQARGLHPAVLKGIVCRSLYPEPEQRASVDEDLLVEPEDYPRYHEALLALGLQPADPGAVAPDADEISYRDDKRGLFIELHMSPFPRDSEAYGDCADLFDGALDRVSRLCCYGRELSSLSATDHMLYLLCHAYKHMLHGGVGIRQICDICLFARRYGTSIDWNRVRVSCEQIHIEVLAAAMFRIGERHLEIPAPVPFGAIETDELPLLHDCLSGGLYGADEPDRLHSSTLTLEAVAAEKSGRQAHGAVHALFLPVESLAPRFPYLRRHPWLLPVAWIQRAWNYLKDRDRVDPARSLQIGEERIRLLERYAVLTGERHGSN